MLFSSARINVAVYGEKNGRGRSYIRLVRPPGSRGGTEKNRYGNPEYAAIISINYDYRLYRVAAAYIVVRIIVFRRRDDCCFSDSYSRRRRRRLTSINNNNHGGKKNKKKRSTGVRTKNRERASRAALAAGNAPTTADGRARGANQKRSDMSDISASGWPADPL